MASLSQITANRANAQFSTGPRTPEGKARSSRNRLTHGLCGPHTILPDEAPAEYQYLIDALFDEHDPATPTETLLVAQMAQAQWKLNRIARFEANLLAPDCDGQRAPTPSGADHVEFEPNHSGVSPTSELRSPNSLAVSSLIRYDSAAHRAFDRALNNLRKLKSDRAQAAAPARHSASDLDRECDRHLLDLVFGPPAMARERAQRASRSTPERPVDAQRAARAASGAKQSAVSPRSASPSDITTLAELNNSNPNTSHPADGSNESAPSPESAAPEVPYDSNPIDAASASLASIRRLLSAIANDSDPIPPGETGEDESDVLRQAEADEWLDAWLEGRPRGPLSSLADCETKPNR